MHNLRVVLIPYWLRDLVQQQGQHINSIVDYGKIKSLLSTDNKITLLQTQELALGRFSAEALCTSAFNLSDLWMRGAEASSEEIGSYLTEATRRSQENAGSPDLLAQLRLELDTPITPKEPVVGGAPLAEAIDTGTGTVGIVIESQIGKIGQEELYELVQNVLRIFYQYESPYQVANHPIFRTYLDMMRKSKMVGA